MKLLGKWTKWSLSLWPNEQLSSLCEPCVLASDLKAKKKKIYKLPEIPELKRKIIYEWKREKSQHDTLILIIHYIPYTYFLQAGKYWNAFALVVIELFAFQGWNYYISAKKSIQMTQPFSWKDFMSMICLFRYHWQ